MNGAYGEYTKLLNTGGCLDQIAAFIEWLPSQGLAVCHGTHDDGSFRDSWEPMAIWTPRDLAARFYGIDLDQAATERERMTNSFERADEYLGGNGNPVEDQS